MTALLKIDQLANRLGLSAADWEPRGWHQAKLALDCATRWQHRPQGRLIGVTAINPTPLGEGKTVVTIGLAMALCRLGQTAIATLRQPSLAPVFGIKGGGAGGGRATLEPASDINLHFTGDLHAVAAAHNLLAALVDNHSRRGQAPRLSPESITWRRVIDCSDKGLSQIVTGLGHHPQAPVRETGFDLTAASEVMAIVALARDLADCRERLARMVVGHTPDQQPVTPADLGVTDALLALLRDALRPNLVQTCEGTPALVHAGPFANIAHGNSSVLADLAASRLAPFVVTESGFGADCGAEKLLHIKCPLSGLVPRVEVLVCTLRALKLHSGLFDVRPGQPLPPGLLQPNEPALRAGLANLQAHLDLLHAFQLPVIVAVNRFPEDTSEELELLLQLARDAGAEGVAPVDVFAQGGAGALELARQVVELSAQPSRFAPLYLPSDSLDEKLRRVATRVYGAGGVRLEPRAQKQLEQLNQAGHGRLPVCIAKTQYSLSHDPQLLGRPGGFMVPIRELRLAAGAGFVYALAGEISTLPGLPPNPAARRIRVMADGTIEGLS
ncbi:MAG: formate--tetrahydrofolate ligase [Planctomycetaceae bacterium]